MKNKKWIILIILLAVLIIGGLFWYFSNNANNDNDSKYQASRTSANDESVDSNNESTENQNPPVQIIEEQLSTFSTKIYTKDSARQNNISITTNTLNGTVVKNADTFSFCGIIGPSSSSKGYQEADIFDKNGNKKKGLGGGNCQISSTLYNAVLATPNLVVTERHSHSNSVPYVQKGKDAAVAYGSYDLKFRNDTGNDVRIDAQATPDTVTITLTALKTQ